MANDLLTIPSSTVTSESAFSASKRVLSDRMCKLSKKYVEASVCLKDWYDAIDRLQNLNLNNESVDDEISTSTGTEASTND